MHKIFILLIIHKVLLFTSFQQQLMSEKQQEFPFEEFVQSLSDDCNLPDAIKTVIAAIGERNIYWTYSAISTILEMLKSKDEDPFVKCRCLHAAYLMAATCEYPIITLIQVYLLTLLKQIAFFRCKSKDLVSYYFQQTYNISDSPQIKKYSCQFVERSIELIFLLAKIKPFRTVQIQQLKQKSSFSEVAASIIQRGIQQPKEWKWNSLDAVKNCRRLFLQRLKEFSEQSDQWAEFLLVNLLQEIKSNKRQLFELRQMLSYGQSFLTSPIINVCEDQLMDLANNFEIKGKYLSLLNELVRFGDIEAIIMIKNSDFLPMICSRIGKINGHLAVAEGEKAFPQIQAKKQIKVQFYCDILRCLENWARAMPADYDGQQFNLKSIYTFLKVDKKFKFPENLHLTRYEKDAKQNLLKNQERNNKLVEILQNQHTTKNMSSSHYSQFQSRHKVPQSNEEKMLSSSLHNKLEIANNQLKNLLINEVVAEKALNYLISFKDNWIGYLQTLDIEQSDEAELQQLVTEGQKCVEKIQLIAPLGTAWNKGKITYQQFKLRAQQNLEFHNEVSHNNMANSISKKSIHSSKQYLKNKNSKHISNSKLGKSKLAGRDLKQKLKNRSRFTDRSKLDMSKALDRSNFSKKTDNSKLNRSKHTDRPNLLKNTNNNNDLHQMSDLGGLGGVNSDLRSHKSQNQGPNKCNQMKVNDSGSLISVKKSKKVQQQYMASERESKIKKISDYQHYQFKPSQIIVKKQRQKSFQSSRGSRILNRSKRNSYLEEKQKSIQKQNSYARQKSLSQGSKIEHHKTKKTSEIEQELGKDKSINNTIEIKNSNIVKKYVGDNNTLRRDEQYNFQKEVDSISSIHSGSNIYLFQNSAQKILNITEKQGFISNKNKNNDFIQINDRNMLEQDLKQDSSNQNDFISGHDARPMKNSYYNDSSLNLQKQDDNPQFKAIFANKNEIFSSKQKQQKLLRHNSGLKNIIKAKKNVSQDKNSIINKFSSFQKKGQVHPIKSPSKMQKIEYDDYMTVKVLQMQQEKDREITNLRQKIRQLERQTMSMRTQLIAKDNELKSIKSGSINGSQREFQFTSPSHSNFGKTSQSRSQKASLRGNLAVIKEISLFQKQIQNKYKQYLEKITGTTFRKSLLKLKCLIHKTDEIEIGCLSQRGEALLESTIYFTPHHHDLLDFTITVQHDNNLKIKIYPEQAKIISVKKQQKIHLTIEVLNIPFCLPQIEINYKSASQYNSNYTRLALPLAFNKFCELQPLHPQTRLEKSILYVKTDNFKLNPKIVKLQKLIDSFPNFTLLPPNKDRIQWLLIGRCRYGDSIFHISLNLNQKNSWIEGFLLQGSPNAMYFLLCTYKDTLDANKK